MENIDDMIGMLYLEAEKLHRKYELSQNREPDFFEPIMLEYLDKFDGIIGDELGMFHFEYENIIKALFVDRGSYILKLANGEKIIRDTYKKMKDVNTDI